MPKVVTEFSSENGPVRVEMDAPGGKGPVRVGRGGDVIEKANQSFEQSVAGIPPIAEGILAQATGLAQAPKSVEVSFSASSSQERWVSSSPPRQPRRMWR